MKPGHPACPGRFDPKTRQAGGYSEHSQGSPDDGEGALNML